MSDIDSNCGRKPSAKICPRENGLTEKGEFPPDPDACISCGYAVWNYEGAEG